MRHSIHLPFLLLALSSGAATARAAVQVDPPEAFSLRRVEGHGLLAGLAHGRVLFDEREDELWALGNSYKAGFDREGAVFVPFFGSDAPRNLPLRLRVVALRAGAGEVAFDRDAVPLREGTSVSYERGAFVERYDLGPESMEQSFLVRERAGPGSLVIELDLESELDGSSDGLDLLFAGERGHVRYTGAVAIDARGERVAAPTRLVNGRIEIEVPEAELGRLRFPLVVDPILSTFNIVPPTVLDGFSPDTAFDLIDRVWAVVFERAFSATDHDVFSMRIDENGDELWDSVIDASPTSWSAPKVANHFNNSQFLIVASVGATGARTIKGRTQSADPPTMSSVIDISPASFDNILPDVGGDAAHNAPSMNYCVVWQRVTAPNDSDIYCRMIRTSSAPDGSAFSIVDAPGTSEAAPSIASRSDQGPLATRGWTVAWHRWTLFDSDLFARRVGVDGALQASTLALETTITNARFPSVSSPTADGRTLIAYMRGSVGSTRTFGYVMRDLTIDAYVNLTTLTGAPAAENHVYPNVDSDDRSFVLVESRTIPNSTYYGVHASTLTWLDGRLALSEGHMSVGASGQSGSIPRIACGPGPTWPTLAVWHWEGFGPNPTLFGSLYRPSSFTSFCEPGANGVMACPCGNDPYGPGRGCQNSAPTAGAKLSATGTVSPDTVTLTATDMNPNALCLLVQGSLIGVDAPFGDGVRCVYGTILRMGVHAAWNGQTSWPGPAEAPLTTRSASQGDSIQPGSPRFYFAYYRDPAAGWACGPTFNATQALQVLW